MGLYCSLTMPVRCPFCGTLETRECQTKDLQGIYDYEQWKVGDDILADFPGELHCIASCGQPGCKEEVTYLDGRKGEREKLFYVTVKLDRGVITGEHEVLKQGQD